MAPQKRKRKISGEGNRSGSGYKLARSCTTWVVQPLGNMLVSGAKRNARDEGLGSLRVFSDEQVCDILGLLGGRDLARLALVSRGLYVFSQQDFLWRALVLDELHGEFVFQGTWRRTYAVAASKRDVAQVPKDISIRDFFSDYLFQSWLCASVEVKDEWTSRDNIERRSGLTMEEFIRDFEEPNKPVLITDAISSWPAMSRWSRDYLLSAAGDVPFAAGPVDMKLKNYFTYADTVKEERPLYIFDPKFGEKAPKLAADFEVPLYFREDLFSLLGKERPDYRWLILGPAGSGSSFHVDPNSTSAWNAVIRGSKKWILYPPDVVPPGVHPSPDGAEVAAPVSITEWFMNFYGETKRLKEKPVECICRAGEVVFVPNGWWHTVINLEDSIAITQNYVSRSNLLNVLEFLSRPNSKDLVSGTNDRTNLYSKFKSVYEQQYPGSIEKLRERKQTQARSQKLSFWETVVDTHNGGFKFNFN